MATSTETITPAATVVVMRDRADGPPDLLMLERSAAMSFAGGALVFPGGRVDPGDLALADVLGADDKEEAAARIAAVRESIEEAGIAVALDPAPDAAALAVLRAALHAGDSFGEALARAGTALALDRLVPFARWLPRGMRHRIFDTRFYLIRAPDDAEPTVDGTENSRLFWASAQSVLDDADAGRVTIIFPTRRNLERLARYATFDDAVADARAHPVETVTPWIEVRDGVERLCIPEGIGYPVTSEPTATAHRA
ncbi:NUDIX hydrolase [Sphingomonas sp.]|uniref:NUDIX hydrolase n=1 Tax=Sphingomonas sp. TaxID=28214 RepID=UPI002CB660A7|nr:NUDIX domain-containing protein [Sphingomonas sp.]HWK36324.1 NUDIX domain-containing protein [Sphingomonas sp.]